MRMPSPLKKQASAGIQLTVDGEVLSLTQEQQALIRAWKEAAMAESLSLARHIFLTGEKQVGKSTLWRRLIARQQLRCAGFETRLLMLEGQRRGFILHGRVDMDPASNDCIVSVRTGPRKKRTGAGRIQRKRRGDTSPQPGQRCSFSFDG